MHLFRFVEIFWMVADSLLSNNVKFIKMWFEWICSKTRFVSFNLNISEKYWFSFKDIFLGNITHLYEKNKPTLDSFFFWGGGVGARVGLLAHSLYAKASDWSSIHAEAPKWCSWLNLRAEASSWGFKPSTSKIS